MQALLAAAVLASLLPACAGAGRGATPLQPGAITSEPAPPGEPFAADYEDEIMGGAPTVDSVVKTWAGQQHKSALRPQIRPCPKLHVLRLSKLVLLMSE